MDTPPAVDRRPIGRRTFLTGAAGVVGVVAPPLLAPAAAAAAPSADPFWRSLTDPAWHPVGTRSVVGDGATDDTTAIQRVMDALASPSAGVAGAYLVVPPGEYVLTDTITINRFAGIMQGTGVGHTPDYFTPEGQGSVFRWAGPAGRPMFRITDSFKLGIRDVRFEGNDASLPTAALDFRWTTGQSAGTNSELVVSDCQFGTWPWAHDGINTGIVRSGILISGDNGNNDQFRILRCHFSGGGAAATTGIAIDNTQSVWGSITDCTFDSLATGIATSSSTSLYNAQFNRCRRDLDIRNTAQVDVFGWQSEGSGMLAALGSDAGLRSVGGSCQISGDAITPGSPLIDAFPSGHSTVSLTGMRFSWPAGKPASQGGRYPNGIEDVAGRPAIIFGPDQAQSISAGGAGFLIKIADCIGLHADQCKLVGSMYGVVPRSRGLVEWYSRHKGGIEQFRNELWNAAAGAGTRPVLAYDRWDPPRPGTRN